MKKDDVRMPIGGLDTDTDDRLLAKTDYRYAKNGRSGASDKDSTGATEGIRGNSLFEASLNNGERTIGTATDIKNNAVIKFVYNPLRTVTFTTASVTTTSPFVINITGPGTLIPVGTIISVAQNFPNAFTAEVINIVGVNYTLTLLTGTAAIGVIVSITIPNYHYIKRHFESTGLSEFLTNPALMGRVFAFNATDRIYNPRIIEAGFTQLLTWVTCPNGVPRLMDIDKMKFGGEYYDIAADEQYINLIKRKHYREPDVRFGDLSNTDVNLLGKQYFQFRYRFIYDDNQIGDCTPISDITIPDNLLTKNNVIIVGMRSGHHTVKKVEVMLRRGNGSSDTGEINPEWYSFNIIDKEKEGIADDTYFEISFLGSETLKPIARIDTDKIFESVPIYVDHIELSDTNQIILAEPTEGRNNVEMDAVLEARYRLSGVILYQTAGLGMVFSQTLLPTEGATIYYTVEKLSPPGTITAYTQILTAPDVVSSLSLANAVAAFITSKGFTTIITPLGGDQYLVEISGADYLLAGTSMDVDTLNRRTYLFSPRQYEISVVYYDKETRNGGANPIDIISFKPQDGITPPFDNGTVPYIRVIINNLAPEWATKYSLVIRFNRLEYVSSNAMVFGATGAATISPKVTWTWQDGDRIRFIGGEIDITKANDYILESYDSSTGAFEITGLDYSTQNKVAFIFYRYPNQIANSSPYFEFTGLGIQNLNGQFHSGNIQNQTGIQPAIIDLFNGDQYVKPIYTTTTLVPSGSFTYPLSIYVSEFIDETIAYSNVWGKGRVQIETPTQREQKYNMLRWGNELFPNTQINNLSVWDEGNYVQLNARFGNITGIRQIGYTLSIVQWGNVSKAFIKRIEQTNADGSTFLVLTDNFIGTINPGEDELGTKHPGTICINGSNLYFLDTIKGKYIRNASNGNFPISDYNFRRYWRDASELINLSSNYEVITGFDHKFNDLYVTIRNTALSPDYQETVYFNENQNKWKYFVDMTNSDGDIIDWYGWVGQSFFTFLKNNTWQQNILVDDDGNAKYLNLFGHDKDLVVETIGMLDPDKVKIFTTHAVHSNIIPRIVEFFIPANTMYPNGMYSRLKPGNYKYAEGVFYGSIKCDAYTKGIPQTNEDLIRQIAVGRPMRGHVVKTRLTYTTNAYLILFSTTTGMVASERS